MQKQLSLLLLFVLGITVSCKTQHKPFTLQDYYSNDAQLNTKVDEVYAGLSDEQRVAQMLITSLGKLGKPYTEVEPLIKEQKVGGVIFLSGDPEQFKKDIESIRALNPGFPLLMSMDAEPSLFNRRMPGTPDMKPTAELKTPEEIKEAVSAIDETLHHVGFAHNYAPVIDVSPNNEAIGNRTLGSDSNTIVPLALSFIEATQNDQIIATAKHFPGHGRVSGDTHKKLVYIDGELTEVSLYKPIIEAGVLSIMVGHIAIENNPKYTTNGLPSTLSSVVVSQLLRDEMGFDGLIITDAMNMGAVQAIPNSTLLAAKAGCDIILMPPDEIGTLTSILAEMKINESFKQQIEASVKRIIRAKLCLGMEFTTS
jgi:beta-N-acetylhexosaminidase